MTDFDTDALKAAVEKAFICTILGEQGNADSGIADMFADCLGEIVDMGPRAVHVALSGWCGLTLQGFARSQGDLPADGFWCLEVENDLTGEAASIDQIDNPALRDAMRIVTCFGNNDHATIAAIVKAAWEDGNAETLTNLLFESVRLAAQTARHFAAERGEEGGSSD